MPSFLTLRLVSHIGDMLSMRFCYRTGSMSLLRQQRSFYSWAEFIYLTVSLLSVNAVGANGVFAH
jgi:hypothetical protein